MLSEVAQQPAPRAIQGLRPSVPARPRGDDAGRSRTGAGLVLGAALLLSGAAGLINQVVWQRSLKVFLGGGETIASMVVVLVFMAGLGAGSVWMGGRAGVLRDPLRWLARIELLLALLNGAICALLRSDIADSVFAVQTVARSFGVPLLLLYGLGAVAVLLPPCLLMGATMPLAAETCQRRLGLTDPRVLGALFFINTAGSVASTCVCSGFMIAEYGQTVSLLCAVLLNASAGVVLLVLTARHGTAAALEGGARSQPRPAEVRIDSPRRSAAVAPESVAAFGLGFCSLAFEMYLLRVIPLRHEPLPFTFAAVLAGFLLVWSIGSACSARPRMSLSTAMRIAALGIAATIPMFVFDRPARLTDAWSLAGLVIVRMPYFVPCFFFGYLFGLIAARAARSWGRDVGRIYAWNTAGSCLGVLATTFIGYEMPFFMLAGLLALLMYALQEFAQGSMEGTGPRGAWRAAVPLSGAVLTALLSFAVDFSGVMAGVRVFYGRDGVIGVDEQGNMWWDGLWHSQLSSGGDHIGSNNWYLAVCPFISHSTGAVHDVCVIGVATGITASTLARSDAVQRIDAYDITRTLKTIYRRYPEGTLGIAQNPKIHLIWQDARTGLALSGRRYDLIQAQPLYLKQAGSALLNSREFFELVSRSLKPNGVFCLYSNGTAGQAFAVRQTAAQVFAHGESFHDGYLLVLSNDPLDLSREALAGRLQTVDPLWDEVRTHPETQDADAILKLLDHPRIPWGDGRLLITDDHPIVEYPAYLERAIERLGYVDALPKPGFVWEAPR